MRAAQVWMFLHVFAVARGRIQREFHAANTKHRNCVLIGSKSVKTVPKIHPLSRSLVTTRHFQFAVPIVFRPPQPLVSDR